MKIGVLTFPGSNCDRDIVRVLHEFFHAETALLWHAEPLHERYDLLVVPGGFSYGDYLRAGAIARFAPAMNSLIEHRKRGGPVFGVCNGFQILCEAGLLPGALIRNQSLKHICKTVRLRANPANAFAAGLDGGREYAAPISHGDGNYRIDPDGLAALEDNQQIVFRYQENPNGSVADIAGVSDREQLVLGMMPHPESAVDPITGSGADGREILTALLQRSAAALAR